MSASQSSDWKKYRVEARVLLVDDGPDIRRIVSHFLTKAGAEVIVAEDGRRALEIFAARLATGETFDCIITDMEMPDVDGYEFARALRLRGETLPIIACTALMKQADIDACYEAGCSAHVTKPIAPADLLQEIAQALAAPRQTPACAQ